MRDHMMARLSVNPDQVSYVIALAREIQNALPSLESFDDGDAHVGGAEQQLAREPVYKGSFHELNGSYQELAGYLATLDEDELTSLLALFWIGRGTFEPDELTSALDEARAVGTRRIPDYLMAQNLMAEHLEEGLVALGLTPEEL